MYRITHSSDRLTPEEKKVFQSHLAMLDLDESIWSVYDAFLQTASDGSVPQILRVHDQDNLLAAIYLMKCKDHGETLTSSRWLQRMIRNSGMPVYIWMKSGIAAENFTNPGFINKKATNLGIEELIPLIKKKFVLLFIHDLEKNARLFPNAAKFWYPDNGIIKTKDYSDIQHYLGRHKNLKKKLRHYNKYGGRVEIIKGRLDENLQQKIKNAVLSTSRHSLFKLPYQENYANMCLSSARIADGHILHFVCRGDREFYGYHSFIELKDRLYCMNGAFNRNLPTTHHAYENMIYRSVEYALEKGLSEIHYGPVLNETKKRMMETFIPTQLYFYSSIRGMEKLLSPLLKRSRLQNTKMMEYSHIHR
mgnify:CR=1 FL=1